MKRWPKATSIAMEYNIKEGTTMKKFAKFVKMEQKSLKAKLRKVLKSYYRNVIDADGFLYAKGKSNCPILLTAHMDTVHEETVKTIESFTSVGGTVVSSPQGIGGDDRCGIWIIYKILTTTKYRPSILFCEDEEIGGVGSNKFAKTDYIKDFADLKYLVELDRANNNDAVYYNCGNEDFKVYIEKAIGYKEAYGSFSDIGHLSPACDRASVNLSCGYYKQHTLKEYVVLEEMENTLEKVKVLLADADNCPVYDYQEDRWDRYYRSGRYGYDYGYSGYSSWWDRYYDSAKCKEDKCVATKDLDMDIIKEDEDDKELADVLGQYNADSDNADELLDEDKWKFEFQYYTLYGEEEFVCEAWSLEEAVGMLMMENPNLTWNMVYDYAQY